MSQQQYNNLISNLLKEKQALTLLRTQLEEKREREYQSYRKFRYLAHNYRIKKKKKKKKKEKAQNQFEILASRVMRSGEEERYIRNIE